MRYALGALCLLFSLTCCLTGCDSENTAPPGRLIDTPQTAPSSLPMEGVDGAVRTEAVANYGRLHTQLKYALARNGGDISKLAADVGGALNATKLGKLGMGATDLDGQFYRASDYTLTFSGNSVTIKAGGPGTRGDVPAETFKLQ